MNGLEAWRTGWTVAARDREGFDRLADRVRTAERAADERREAAEVDDLVVTRWRPVDEPAAVERERRKDGQR